MSNKYKHGDVVPTEVLAARLKELSSAIARGDFSDLYMRIPAEMDHCADLVMDDASRRLTELTAKVNNLENPWISVADSLPERGETVLCLEGGKHPETWDYLPEIFEEMNVTHWTHTPKLPSGGNT